MAVAFRSSSIRGSSDNLSTSCAIPVPAGATTGDIVVCFLGHYLAGNQPGPVTPPAGFTQIVPPQPQGNAQITAFWKRLTGADSGPYTFTWEGGTVWSNGSAVAVTGAAAAGDPIEDFHATGASSNNYPSLTVTTATEPFLAWGAYNDPGDSGPVPPTGYIEIQPQPYGTTAWQIPGTVGDHTATGAAGNSSTSVVAILVAVAVAAEPDADGAVDLTGTAPAAASATGALTASRVLSGTSDAASDTAGTLTRSGPSRPPARQPAAPRVLWRPGTRRHAPELSLGGSRGAGPPHLRVRPFRAPPSKTAAAPGLPPLARWRCLSQLVVTVLVGASSQTCWMSAVTVSPKRSGGGLPLSSHQS